MIRLALLVLAQVVYSAAYISYFSSTFEYGSRLIVLHLCIIVSLLSAGMLVFGVASRARPRTARVGIAVASATGFGCLTLLYGANLVSVGAWGHNVTFDIASRYATRPAVLATYLMTVTTWYLAALLGAVIVAGMIYLASSRVVADGLRRLFAGPGMTPAARHAIAVVLAMTCLLPALAGAGLVYTALPRVRPVLLSREPLIGFFVNPASAHRLALSTFAARFREEGPRVRASYQPGQAFERRNVIVILVDSLRADHLQIYGYQRPTTPFLERLRSSGKLQHAQLAMATCPESNCGVSSVLASKTFGSLVPENFAIHELFFDRGYDVNFILSGDHNWYGMREFYGDDVTVYFDGTMSGLQDPTDDRVVFEGLETVPSFTGNPAFFYFHLMSAHVIGYKQERYQRFQPSINLKRRHLIEVDLATHVNSYDNGVLQADAVIDQLFDALNRKGYLANALVVISSDHGEGLGEHGGMRGHAFQGSLYQEFLTIPLLIYDERGGDYRNLEFATQVDVAPTIVTRLGLPVPSSWEGRSLLEHGVRPFSYHYMDTHNDGPVYAMLHPVGGALYKYLWQPSGEELFELTTDPGERVDQMATADPAIVRRFRERLSDVLATTEP